MRALGRGGDAVCCVWGGDVVRGRAVDVIDTSERLEVPDKVLLR